jgi:flagellin
LVLHAKNTGVNDTISIAADQNQVDEAVNALNKIANNTFFGGKSLLNGSLGNTATVVNSTKIASAVAGTAAPAGTNLIAVDVTTAATRATSSGSVDVSSGTAGAGTVTVNGFAISLTDTATQAATIAELQSGFTTNGLDLTAVANGNNIDIRHNQYGSAYSVSVNDASGLLRGAGFNSGVGIDAAGTIAGSTATGAGLTLTASGANPYLGMVVTLTSSGNAVATYTNAISSTQGSLTFQVGSSASDTVSTTIQDVRAAALGTTAGGSEGLNAILTGATYNLTTDPTTALSIIDEAINDVSTARAQLGAIQKYTLETKVNSLNVALENVTASESRVRDVDMASEMANFTKFQVLIQSATAMLAQANQSPTSILSLLGR